MKLTFPSGAPLVNLVDYVSDRTHTRFLYDESLTGNVTIRSPLDVKVADLLPLLRSILEFKGYQLVETNGWYRIRRGQRADTLRAEPPAAVFLVGGLPEDLKADAVYALLIEPKFLDTDALLSALQAAAGVTPVKVSQTGTLILVDYGSRIKVAADMLELLDRPAAPLSVVVYAFRQAQASQVKDMALGILRARVAPSLTTGGPQAQGPSLYIDQTGNRMILLLPPDTVQEATRLLTLLDAEGPAELRTFSVKGVPATKAEEFMKAMVRARAPGLPDIVIQQAAQDQYLVIAPPKAQDIISDALATLEKTSGLELEFYPVEHVQASRMETLVRAVLQLDQDQGSGEFLMAAPDENMLIARLTPAMQQRLGDLLKRFDTSHEAVKSTRLQFFQIRNTDASELAQRLRAVLGVTGGEAPAQVQGAVERVLSSYRYGGFQGTEPAAAAPPAGAAPEVAVAVPAPEVQAGTGAAPSTGGAKGKQPGQPSLEASAVRIVADQNTNTIIVQAPPEYLETIGQLVQYLDRRRPQVLIEATLVTISVNSDLSVAVELLRHRLGHETEALVFSAFGLSTVDVSTGTSVLKPGTGFNASVVDEDGSSAILRAIRTDDKSRVIAEPKLLVNDNKTGVLQSTREEPYTSVNIGQSVSTTTFAGYAEAGLTIEVTPKISEGDFIRLEYAITSRDFSGSGDAGIPPPRTSDVIASNVTVPDGHTIIIGGLSRDTGSVSEDKVPILGDIPILGFFFRSRDSGSNRARLFVFLRPVILRDDDFSDLKTLSGADILDARKPVVGQDSIYPPVKPRVMR